MSWKAFWVMTSMSSYTHKLIESQWSSKNRGVTRMRRAMPCIVQFGPTAASRWFSRTALWRVHSPNGRCLRFELLNWYTKILLVSAAICTSIMIQQFGFTHHIKACLITEATFGWILILYGTNLLNHWLKFSGWIPLPLYCPTLSTV